MTDLVPVRLEVLGVHGLDEITEGADLATLVTSRLDLEAGDVVVITSKVVSKAAGRVVRGDRSTLVAQHSTRDVARRGRTRIARTVHGLTLAAAGLDSSNTEPGTVVLLPEDPDADAVRLRLRMQGLTGLTVAVIVTDTAGRAWRHGQTDLAIGVAGLPPYVDLAGRPDSHGIPLAVTAPAVADEVAAAADLVQGKTAGVPVALVRGLAHLVLPRDDHGPGARALVRPAGEDLFGLGAADAVRAATRRDDPAASAGFPLPDTDAADLVSDALVACPAGVLDVRGLHGDVWELSGSAGADPAMVAWQLGALVERLRALAASTRRTLSLTPSGHTHWQVALHDDS